MRALHTAATGMMAQELNVQVISNNIANMRTTAYKRQRAEFQDLLYEHVSRVGTQTSSQGNILPAGIELGSGVKTVGTPRIMTQGNLLQTVALEVDGRPLQGEFLRSASIVNTMIKQLSVFTSEVTRVAREVGTEGKLGGQARVKELTGVWRDLSASSAWSWTASGRRR